MKLSKEQQQDALKTVLSETATLLVNMDSLDYGYEGLPSLADRLGLKGGSDEDDLYLTCYDRVIDALKLLAAGSRVSLEDFSFDFDPNDYPEEDEGDNEDEFKDLSEGDDEEEEDE